MKSWPEFEWKDKGLLKSIRAAKLRRILSKEGKEDAVQSL